jgi:hypothetical protein
MPKSFTHFLAVVGAIVLIWWGLCKVGEGIGSVVSKTLPPGSGGGGRSSQPAPPASSAPAGGEVSTRELLEEMRAERADQARTDNQQNSNIQGLRTDVRDLGTRIDRLARPQQIEPAERTCIDCDGTWIRVPPKEPTPKPR